VRLTDGTDVGHVTSPALHHELGPVALAVVRRSVPADEVLVVDDAGGPVTAGQDVIVPVEGQAPDRPPARGPLTPGLRPRPLL
jgi:hypothetical protein